MSSRIVNAIQAALPRMPDDLRPVDIVLIGRWVRLLVFLRGAAANEAKLILSA